MDEEKIMEILNKHFKFNDFKSSLQQDAVFEIAKSTLAQKKCNK